MIIDGKQLAAALLDQLSTVVREGARPPHLTIVTMTPDFVTQNYLTYKKHNAEAVGILVNIIECPKEVTTTDMVMIVEEAVRYTDGVIVQLPLPAHIDTDAVLAAIPLTHDVDAFRYAASGGDIVPPVVGAIAAIANAYDVCFEGKKAVVLGRGRLVGAPAARFLETAGATVTVVDKGTDIFTMEQYVAEADILVSGVGVPHLITAAMVKEGVIIFDAGTSEASGKLAGDVESRVAEKAALMTPVPGGIGPLTIACLLQNVTLLALQHDTRAPK